MGHVKGNFKHSDIPFPKNPGSSTSAITLTAVGPKKAAVNVTKIWARGQGIAICEGYQRMACARAEKGSKCAPPPLALGGGGAVAVASSTSTTTCERLGCSSLFRIFQAVFAIYFYVMAVMLIVS